MESKEKKKEKEKKSGVGSKRIDLDNSFAIIRDAIEHHLFLFLPSLYFSCCLYIISIYKEISLLFVYVLLCGYAYGRPCSFHIV